MSCFTHNLKNIMPRYNKSLESHLWFDRQKRLLLFPEKPRVSCRTWWGSYKREKSYVFWSKIVCKISAGIFKIGARLQADFLLEGMKTKKYGKKDLKRSKKCVATFQKYIIEQPCFSFCVLKQTDAKKMIYFRYSITTNRKGYLRNQSF